MEAPFFLGLLSGALVFLAALLGGASLAGAALRSLGALALFSALGWLVQAFWRAAASETRSAVGGQATRPATPSAAAAASAGATKARPPAPDAAGTARPVPAEAGQRLDQVLPAASPADLFEPLNPPVLTTRGTEE